MKDELDLYEENSAENHTDFLVKKYPDPDPIPNPDQIWIRIHNTG
jgi:hypothetical protein